MEGRLVRPLPQLAPARARLALPRGCCLLQLLQLLSPHVQQSGKAGTAAIGGAVGSGSPQAVATAAQSAARSPPHTACHTPPVCPRTSRGCRSKKIRMLELCFKGRRSSVAWLQPLLMRRGLLPRESDMGLRPNVVSRGCLCLRWGNMEACAMRVSGINCSRWSAC